MKILKEINVGYLNALKYVKYYERLEIDEKIIFL